MLRCRADPTISVSLAAGVQRRAESTRMPQRVHWIRKGLENAKISGGDSLGAERLQRHRRAQWTRYGNGLVTEYTIFTQCNRASGVIPLVSPSHSRR